MICEKTLLQKERLSSFVRGFLTEEALLFDIETTGLSPARDLIYCIGCGLRTGDEIRAELFFSESPEEEEAVLDRFLALVRTHPDLVTFNGAAFDIPFIRKRSSLYPGLSGYGDGADPAEEPGAALLPGARSHLDIYREVRKMRGLLGLSSYKQKSIERFLGVGREDIYSGKELIDFYGEYVRRRDPALLSPMLTHNRDDVAGMFDLLGILAYRQFAGGRFRVTDTVLEGGIAAPAGNASISDGPSGDAFAGFLNVKLRPEYPLPRSIRRIPVGTDESGPARDGISFILDRESALVRIPIYRGELKHFFDDPENYFYLPDEDTVVHKSVGRFVDPSHRKKASKRTCFIKKECDYISLSAPCGLAAFADRSIGCLRKDYDDRDICLEIPASKESLKTFIGIYFSHL